CWRAADAAEASRRGQLLAVVEGLVLGGLLQGEIGSPRREADRAGLARPLQAQRVRRALQGDVPGAARAVVAGDADRAHAVLLVVAVRGQLSVQGQQTVEEDVLVRETAELLVRGVALRHLHVLRGQLLRRRRVGRGAALAVAVPVPGARMTPELRARLQEQLVVDAQQAERLSAGADRPHAALGLEPHVERVAAPAADDRAVQPDGVDGLGGLAGPSLDLLGGQLADPVGALVRVLGASRQRRPNRKSTRLNSSHAKNSYAVFCL